MNKVLISLVIVTTLHSVFAGRPNTESVFRWFDNLIHRICGRNAICLDVTHSIALIALCVIALPTLVIVYTCYTLFEFLGIPLAIVLELVLGVQTKSPSTELVTLRFIGSACLWAVIYFIMNRIMKIK